MQRKTFKVNAECIVASTHPSPGKHIHLQTSRQAEHLLEKKKKTNYNLSLICFFWWFILNVSLLRLQFFKSAINRENLHH